MIMMLGVFTSLFVLAPLSGPLVSRAQIRRTAGLGTDRAKRDQPPHVFRATRWTCGCRTSRPFKMLKLLLTLETFVLKNGHRTSMGTGTPVHVQMYSKLRDGNNRLFFWNDSPAVMNGSALRYRHTYCSKEFRLAHGGY